MAGGIQTANGKAFEYACVLALYRDLHEAQQVQIEDSPQLNTAKSLYDRIDFGKEWLNIPCSENYFSRVVPLFDQLRTIRDQSKIAGKPALWEEIEKKRLRKCRY